MPSWVQDPVTGKLIPKGEYIRAGPVAPEVIKPLEPFVSPIDGSLISDRSHLREHNRKHGVTNSADYSHEFMLKRSTKRTNELQGKTKEAQQERKQLIDRTLREYGI